MSEKNGEIVQEIKARWSEGRCFDVSFETVKLAAVDIQVLCRIIHDHEALIGVLVGALDFYASGFYETGYDHTIQSTRALKEDKGKTAQEALSHPLVQEYLKKEKI